MMKALMLELRGEFPKTHSLVYLSDRLAEHGIHPNEEGERVIRLIEPFGDLRYPNPKAPVGISNRDGASIDALWWELVYIRPSIPDALRQRRTEDAIVKGGRMLVMRTIDGDASE